MIFAPLTEAIHLGSKLLEGQCRRGSSYEVIVCGAEIGTRDPREAVCWGRSYVSVFSITHGSICRVSNFQGSVSGYASHLQTQQEAQAPNRVRPGCCARPDATDHGGKVTKDWNVPSPETKAIKVELVWDPPWTSDRMSEAARRQFGW